MEVIVAQSYSKNLGELHAFALDTSGDLCACRYHVKPEGWLFLDA